VVAIKRDVVVMGLPLGIFREEKTALGIWTSNVASRELDFLLSNTGVRGKVDELMGDFNEATHAMLDSYIMSDMANIDLKKREALVHKFFDVLQVVKDLHAATDAAEALRGEIIPYVRVPCVFVSGGSLSLVEARGSKRRLKRIASDCDPLLEHSDEEMASTTEVELCDDTLIDLDPFAAARQTNYMFPTRRNQLCFVLFHLYGLTCPIARTPERNVGEDDEHAEAV
jgi:hypothetical protein